MRTIVTIPSIQQPANGIISTLGYLDYKLEDLNIVEWNPRVKPAFDMFDELNPDMIICDYRSIPKMERALQEYKTTLVLCGGMPPTGIEPDLILFPEEIPEMIKKHCEYPLLSINQSANLARFRKGKFDKNKSCDVLYYAATENPLPQENHLLSLIAGLDCSFKIIGYRRPLLNYVGNVSVIEASDFFSSAKITLDINGSTEFDVAINKGFCLSTKSNNLYPSIDESNLDTWSMMIPSFIENETKRRSITKSANKKIWQNKSTYFHKTADVFEKLSWNEYATKTLEILEGLTNND